MAHYFEAQPGVGSAPRDVHVDAGDVEFTMATDRGVFSHGRLDTGTRTLIRHAPPLPESGDLLDLGCGAGALAITMALRAPGARVHAVDVNERALDRCAENADRNGLRNVHVALPDDVDRDLRFAAIWSNPPVRIGKAQMQEMLTTWISRLLPAAAAVLVVQRNLGADSLHRWLETEGWPTERLASSKGFRVLRAVAPDPAR